MEKSFRKHLGKVSILTFTGLLCIANNLFAFDAGLAKNYLDEGILVLDTAQNQTDGGWCANDSLRYVCTAAVVQALAASNSYNSVYHSGVAWLENHNANNVDLVSRKIIALTEHGNNLLPDLDGLQYAKREASQSGWGLSAGYYSSPLESALVLQAMRVAGNDSGKDAAVDYLLQSQLNDGGWATTGAENSDYWITSEVVIALAGNNSSSDVNEAILLALPLIRGVETVDASYLGPMVIARSAHALYTVEGLSSDVDRLVDSLIDLQTPQKDWGDTVSTASVVLLLATVLELDGISSSDRIAISDEVLRRALNAAFGKSSYDNITRDELLGLTTLDLRGLGVLDVSGLQDALNLTTVMVDADTDASALAGLVGVDIVIDGDFDDIADNIDNCPADYNSDQANLDGDLDGDVCDDDIDGDDLPNSWESLYDLNPYLAGDASGDLDGDKLTNLEEFNIGTDPQRRDTDNDALFDGIDTAPLQYDGWLMPNLSTLL